MQGLFLSGLKEVAELVVVCCNLFGKLFEDEIACIQLYSAVTADASQGMSRTLSSPAVLDECQLVRLEQVDKVFKLQSCKSKPHMP